VVHFVNKVSIHFQIQNNALTFANSTKVHYLVICAVHMH